jgi:CubicO group peptidase (beta-lactamase class C family)
MKTTFAMFAPMMMAACSGDASPTEQAGIAKVGRYGPETPFALVTGTGGTSGNYTVSEAGLDVGAATPWQWASVTKQFVAVLVMQDVEAGRLALDDTLADHLPDFGTGERGQITISSSRRRSSKRRMARRGRTCCSRAFSTPLAWRPRAC